MPEWVQLWAGGIGAVAVLVVMAEMLYRITDYRE